MKKSACLFVFAFVVPALIACGGQSLEAAGSARGSADTAASATRANVRPSNFVMVRAGLYRGGHPDAAGLDFLKGLGVKRILNLEVGDFIEAFPWQISRELSDAKARNITEIRYPMSAFEPAISEAFDRHMTEILALLKTATPDDGIYVHCKHGQDRTGLVIGLERVLSENWHPKDAHDEMMRIGFHRGFFGLQQYFEHKTEWSDPG